MNIVKRLSVMGLVMALAVSVLAAPASASVYDVPVSSPYLGDFSQFPGVWQSNQYAVATVAVQKFLMLAGDSLAKLIMPAGGADGFCGGKTVEAIKSFQEREHLHVKGEDGYGRVDRVTWERIASPLLMDILTPGDNEIAYFHRMNSSYYTELDVKNNQNVMYCLGAYFAMNHKMEWTDVYFYVQQ